MGTMMTLFMRPAEPEAFDRHVTDVHLPLPGVMPGPGKIGIARITGSPVGEAGCRVVTGSYDASRDAVDTAGASPGGKTAARDLFPFATETVPLFGEVL